MPQVFPLNFFGFHLLFTIQAAVNLNACPGIAVAAGTRSESNQRADGKTWMETISSPIAELCPSLKEAAWFCVRTHLKHEHIAAAHLCKIPGVEVFNPQLRLLRSTRRGRRWNIESLFPNYVFARFVLEATLERVTYTPGVKVVPRFGDQIPDIPDAVIEDLRQGLADLSSAVLTDAPVEGEEVQIVDGAFAGMKALVTRVLSGKQRAQILLNVMGRLVPTELSLHLVLHNRRDAAEIALSRTASFSKRSPTLRNSGPHTVKVSDGQFGYGAPGRRAD